MVFDQNKKCKIIKFNFNPQFRGEIEYFWMDPDYLLQFVYLILEELKKFYHSYRHVFNFICLPSLGNVLVIVCRISASSAV